MKATLFILILIGQVVAFSQFAPPAGNEGTTAIANDSSLIINWANEVVLIERGPEDITAPTGTLASFGTPSEAVGFAEGNSTNVVSLGDGGSITLAFPYPIVNEEGWDFAVFENSFSNTYLEFAHIEVSSDGERFVRIPSQCQIQTTEQTGSFAVSEAEKVNNLAGKYRMGFGTPFDLEDITDSTGIDLNAVLYVRVVDVVGTIDAAFGSVDSDGNLINDPYPTAFESGGFDLDGVGVIHEDNPFATTEKTEFNTVLIYPNPTTGIIYFKGIQTSSTIQLYNLQGQFIQQVGASQFINLNDFGIASGLYIITIQNNDGNIFTKRINYQN